MNPSDHCQSRVRWCKIPQRCTDESPTHVPLLRLRHPLTFANTTAAQSLCVCVLCAHAEHGAAHVQVNDQNIVFVAAGCLTSDWLCACGDAFHLSPLHVFYRHFTRWVGFKAPRSHAGDGKYRRCCHRLCTNSSPAIQSGLLLTQSRSNTKRGIEKLCGRMLSATEAAKCCAVLVQLWS